MKEQDKLKELVTKHRKDFDQKVPPAAVWESIKAKIPRLEEAQEEKKPLVLKRGMGARIWWMAASLLLFAAVGFWYWIDQENRSGHASYPQVTVQEESPMSGVIEMEKSEKPEKAVELSSRSTDLKSPQRTASIVTPTSQTQAEVVKPPVEPERAEKELAGIFTLLHDSLSASNRLEGVLRLAALPEWSAEEVAQIHQSLHRDPNTNVRLAALDALARHIPLEDAAAEIQELLILQDDPAIQLELLMAMLMAPDLELQEATSEHLFALAEDPFTLEFVKEQAYAVLMKVN